MQKCINRKLLKFPKKLGIFDELSLVQASAPSLQLER